MPGHLEDSSIANKSLPRRESVRRLGFVRTLLIDNYDSYTFNTHQALSTINGVPPVVIWNCEWTSYCHYYEDTASDSIVILPGPGSPMCPADIITSLVLIEFLLYVPLLTHMCLSHLEHGSGPVGICLRLLLEFLDIPILGICLGHQALGYVHRDYWNQSMDG